MAVNGTDSVSLKTGNNTVNNEFDDVDEFTAATGAVATLFARNGDDFIRVSTSLKAADGKRAVGTKLDREHPGYRALLAKTAFTGKATLFNKPYMTRYVPLEDRSGEVIGAVFVGVEMTDGLKDLKARIKSLKLGETGYFYALDAQPGPSAGTLVIHPTVEGSNISGAKDASGHEFIKEMLQAKKGVIRYPWLNKELGETQPREKIVAYGHFAPWDWIIGGGSYTDEFLRAQERLRNMLIAAGAAATVLLCGILFLMMRSMVIRPLREAGEVAARVAKGDLTAHIEVERQDEIGTLMRGLSDMTRSLQAAV